MKNNEENLQKLTMIGQMSAAIFHDLQSPVTYIDSNNRYLIKKIRKNIDEKIANELIEILNENNEGLAQIKELLGSIKSLVKNDSLSKIVPINSLIENCVKITQPQANSKVKVTTQLPGQSILVDVNPSQLKQVIINLLVNAIEAFDMDSVKPEIKISCQVSNNRLILKITDNGCGIAEDKVPTVFDWYETSKKHGTGQGLAISQKIIHRHKGEIDCESVLGVGTTFTIRLPLEAVK